MINLSGILRSRRVKDTIPFNFKRALTYLLMTAYVQVTGDLSQYQLLFISNIPERLAYERRLLTYSPSDRDRRYYFKWLQFVSPHTGQPAQYTTKYAKMSHFYRAIFAVWTLLFVGNCHCFSHAETQIDENFEAETEQPVLNSRCKLLDDSDSLQTGLTSDVFSYNFGWRGTKLGQSCAWIGCVGRCGSLIIHA